MTSLCLETESSVYKKRLVATATAAAVLATNTRPGHRQDGCLALNAAFIANLTATAVVQPTSINWSAPASPGARMRISSGEPPGYLRQSSGEQIEDDADSGRSAQVRMRDEPQPGGHLRNRREHLTDTGNCVGHKAGKRRKADPGYCRRSHRGQGTCPMNHALLRHMSRNPARRAKMAQALVGCDPVKLV